MMDTLESSTDESAAVPEAGAARRARLDDVPVGDQAIGRVRDDLFGVSCDAA
jgi:hypothetical protein